MNLPKQVQLLLGLNILSLIIFTMIALTSGNIEFIFYIAVMLFFLSALFFSYKYVQYPNYLLWFLSLWGLLHMAGGLLIIRGSVLYNLMLISLSETYSVLKYDQFVHIFGFFTATLVMYVILRPLLKKPKHIGWALSIILVAAGSGAGAWNEIIEFIASEAIEGTNVGGYLNTSLDTISNLLGGLLAIAFLKYICRDKK